MSFASFFTRLVDGGKDKEQRDRGRDQGRERSRERSVERGEGQGAASPDEGGYPAYPARGTQAAEAQQAGRRGSVGGGGQGGGQGLPMNRRSSFSKMADATEEGFGRAADALGSIWGSMTAAIATGDAGREGDNQRGDGTKEGGRAAGALRSSSHPASRTASAPGNPARRSPPGTVADYTPHSASEDEWDSPAETWDGGYNQPPREDSGQGGGPRDVWGVEAAPARGEAERRASRGGGSARNPARAPDAAPPLLARVLAEGEGEGEGRRRTDRRDDRRDDIRENIRDEMRREMHGGDGGAGRRPASFGRVEGRREQAWREEGWREDGRGYEAHSDGGGGGGGGGGARRVAGSARVSDGRGGLEGDGGDRGRRREMEADSDATLRAQLAATQPLPTSHGATRCAHPPDTSHLFSRPHFSRGGGAAPGVITSGGSLRASSDRFSRSDEIPPPEMPPREGGGVYPGGPQPLQPPHPVLLPHEIELELEPEIDTSDETHAGRDLQLDRYLEERAAAAHSQAEAWRREQRGRRGSDAAAAAPATAAPVPAQGGVRAAATREARRPVPHGIASAPLGSPRSVSSATSTPAHTPRDRAATPPTGARAAARAPALRVTVVRPATRGRAQPQPRRPSATPLSPRATTGGGGGGGRQSGRPAPGRDPSPRASKGAEQRDESGSDRRASSPRLLQQPRAARRGVSFSNLNNGAVP